VPLHNTTLERGVLDLLVASRRFSGRA